MDADPARRLKVVFLDHCAQLSGAEIALHRLLGHLAVEVDATVILAEHGPLEAKLAETSALVRVLEVSSKGDVRKDDVSLRRMATGSMMAWARYTLELARLLRRDRPDVIHTNSLKAALYGGLVGRLIRVPVVWHIRDTWSSDYLPPSALRLMSSAARVLPRRMIANSTPTREAFDALVGPRVARRLVTTVVPNVVPAASFEHSRPTGSGVHTVVMIGRLAPWKGQDVFLRAFAIARNHHPDLRAIVAGSAMFGEDGYVETLHLLANQLGLSEAVEFSGFVEDVPGLLREADLMVHASVTPEPFGQVIVEGMAAGLPVIATDIGGPREIIDDGVDGVLVEPGAADALADALVALCGDPDRAARIGQHAAVSALRYEPTKTVGLLLAMYLELAPMRLKST